MTNETIARECGWRLINAGVNSIGDWVNPDGTYDDIPDYLNDLNAIHEAVVDRDDDFKNRFEWTLNGIAIKQDKYLIEMSAKEWSEAFLRVVGENKCT